MIFFCIFVFPDKFFMKKKKYTIQEIGKYLRIAFDAVLMIVDP